MLDDSAYITKIWAEKQSSGVNFNFLLVTVTSLNLLCDYEIVIHDSERSYLKWE